MRKINVKMIAHKGANQEVFDKGLQLLSDYVPEDTFQFTHTNPDVIFLTTGGSEKEAVEVAAKMENAGIWAHEEDNAYASGTEIKAYFNYHQKKSFLWDIRDKNFPEKVKHLQKIIHARETLNNQQLGLLGNVSDWLVASDVSETILKERFGIDLVPISWAALPSFKKCKRSENFDKQYDTGENNKLIAASQVHSLMQKTIHDNLLDAITVECFPLVKEQGVTACLSLALLNDRKIPAGCEGDLTSITGMMFANALLGEIPWMANINKITPETAKFAHCTIPVSKVNEYTIPTHFETDLSTAIQGDLKAETLTVFRFDAELKKIFISLAQVIDRPKSPNACRTQIEVKMPPEDLQKLREQPLGNHHLFMDGDQREIINLAAKWFGIEVV